MIQWADLVRSLTTITLLAATFAGIGWWINRH